MCQLTLGLPESALAAFQRALPIAPTKTDEGATLNNLSQISQARGDYDTALRYLEQSLAIQREIGNKAGLMVTLHNMGLIAWQTDNGERAMTLWSEAFTIAMETQNAQGIFHKASTLGQVYAQSGSLAQARQLLQLAVEVGKAAGFLEVQEVEAALHSLPPAEV
jgi:tetratricopeptide (TPR) repeat protein